MRMRLVWLMILFFLSLSFVFSTSRVVQAKEAPVISEAQAIEAAKAYAVTKEKIDLGRYQAPTAKLNPIDGTWDISFVVKDPTPPGGYFDVIISGQTGEVEHYFPGE